VLGKTAKAPLGDARDRLRRKGFFESWVIGGRCVGCDLSKLDLKMGFLRRFAAFYVKFDLSFGPKMYFRLPQNRTKIASAKVPLLFWVMMRTQDPLLDRHQRHCDYERNGGK
jgi:hypothetical protein